MDHYKRYRIRSFLNGKDIYTYVDMQTLANIITIQSNSLPTADYFDPKQFIYQFNGSEYADIAEEFLLGTHGTAPTYKRLVAVRRPGPDASEQELKAHRENMWHIDDPNSSADSLAKQIYDFREKMYEKIQRALSASQSQ